MTQLQILVIAMTLTTAPWPVGKSAARLYCSAAACETQDAARQLDWQHVIGDWIELIETAKGYVLEQARSHQQAGSLAEAAGLFAIRAGRGGDDEEKWYARWQHARCLRELGDEKGFVRTALQAFRERPHRAEPLHDLANYYLQTQRAGPAALCAEAALAIPLPEHDVLSVDPGLYETGLRHTFAALASWSQDPEQKERGRKVCDWLALSRGVPAYIRDPARYNSGWYAAPAQTFLPSLQFQPLSIEVFEGFQAGNFGVCRRGDQLILLVRAINWTVQDAYWYVLQGDPPYRNQILLIELDKNLRIVASAHVDAPEDMPSPQTKDHHGFQDPRPFIWRGDLWCLCAVTEFNDRGIAEMVLSRVHCAGPDSYVLRDWRVLPSGMPTQHEKNWMPQIAGDELRLIYSVAPTRILRESGAVLSNEPASIAAETFRGGSQAIPFDDGWLMVVHEVELVNGIKRYFHRFIWMDARNVLRRLSRRFYFRILEQVGPEFVTGLAWHPDDERLVISFATNDADPCLAVVDASDVRAALVEISEHEQASRDVVEGAQAVRDKIVGCYQQDSLVCPIYTSEAPNYDASVIYLESLDQVDGWLEKTTASIISRLLRYQTEIGMRGDVLEVGVHHGRLFLLLALCTVEGERAVAVDLFEDQHLNDSLSGRGDREILERNIRRYAPEATVEILRANSMDLGQEFIKSHLGLRFISIDGGHTREIACNDLKLAEQLLASGGIVALDDIYRTDWSGVTAGLHKYYMDGGRLIPFALTPNKALFTLDHEYLKDYQIMLTKDFSDVLSRVWAHRQYQQFFGFNDVLSFIESS